MAEDSKGETTTTSPPPRQKWEELDPDLLAEIFGHLDTADLVQSVPFVCKPWKRATLLTRCWRTLNLWHTYSILSPGTSFLPTDSLVRFTFTGLLKLLFSKCQRSTTTHLLLQLQGWPEYCFNMEDLQLLLDVCRSVKYLFLTLMDWWDEQDEVIWLIGKWANLEVLFAQGGRSPFSMEPLLGRISSNCEKFWCLQLRDTDVDWSLASAIVKYLPGLKRLDLWKVRIKKEEVVCLLKGLRHLVRLSIRDCLGFDLDSEIAEHASSVERFFCEGCRPYVDEEEWNWDDDVYEVLGTCVWPSSPGNWQS